MGWRLGSPGGATVAAALMASAGVVWAQTADLNISPKRLVLDQKSRSGVVYLFNRGVSPATYSVTLEDKVMTPDGHIGEAEATQATPAAAAAAARLKSAKSMIVFTPHRISLEGGASQVLRVRVQRPADLAAGE